MCDEIWNGRCVVIQVRAGPEYKAALYLLTAIQRKFGLDDVLPEPPEDIQLHMYQITRWPSDCDVNGDAAVYFGRPTYPPGLLVRRIRHRHLNDRDERRKYAGPDAWKSNIGGVRPLLPSASVPHIIRRRGFTPSRAEVAITRSSLRCFLRPYLVPLAMPAWPHYLKAAADVIMEFNTKGMSITPWLEATVRAISACISIQASWRGHSSLSTSEFFTLRLRCRAAICIQRTWRMFLVRSRLEMLRVMRRTVALASALSVSTCLSLDVRSANLLQNMLATPLSIFPEHRLRFAFDLTGSIFLVSHTSDDPTSERGIPQWVAAGFNLIPQESAMRLPGASRELSQCDLMELLMRDTTWKDAAGNTIPKTLIPEPAHGAAETEIALQVGFTSAAEAARRAALLLAFTWDPVVGDGALAWPPHMVHHRLGTPVTLHGSRLGSPARAFKDSESMIELRYGSRLGSPGNASKGASQSLDLPAIRLHVKTAQSQEPLDVAETLTPWGEGMDLEAISPRLRASRGSRPRLGTSASAVGEDGIRVSTPQGIITINVPSGRSSPEPLLNSPGPALHPDPLLRRSPPQKLLLTQPATGSAMMTPPDMYGYITLTFRSHRSLDVPLQVTAKHMTDYEEMYDTLALQSTWQRHEAAACDAFLVSEAEKYVREKRAFIATVKIGSSDDGMKDAMLNTSHRQAPTYAPLSTNDISEIVNGMRKAYRQEAAALVAAIREAKRLAHEETRASKALARTIRAETRHHEQDAASAAVMGAVQADRHARRCRVAFRELGTMRKTAKARDRAFSAALSRQVNSLAARIVDAEIGVQRSSRLAIAADRAARSRSANAMSAQETQLAKRMIEEEHRMTAAAVRMSGYTQEIHDMEIMEQERTNKKVADQRASTRMRLAALGPPGGAWGSKSGCVLRQPLHLSPVVSAADAKVISTQPAQQQVGDHEQLDPELTVDVENILTGASLPPLEEEGGEEDQKNVDDAIVREEISAGVEKPAGVVSKHHHGKLERKAIRPIGLVMFH